MNPRVLYRAATYATDARSTADSVISALTPAAWYRNATGVTEAGGFASQWDDYSGNGRHLIQGTGTNQPAYSAGVLTFDGADNYIRADFVLPQPATVALVMQQDAWTANDRLFSGGSANLCFMYQRTASPQLWFYANSAEIGPNSNLAVGVYGIVVVVFNGASSVLRVNNTTDLTGDPGAGLLGGITLGAYNDGTSAGRISVKEAIVFGSALSDANRTEVVTALNNALTVF